MTRIPTLFDHRRLDGGAADDAAPVAQLGLRNRHVTDGCIVPLWTLVPRPLAPVLPVLIAFRDAPVVERIPPEGFEFIVADAKRRPPTAWTVNAFAVLLIQATATLPNVVIRRGSPSWRAWQDWYQRHGRRQQWAQIEQAGVTRELSLYPARHPSFPGRAP